MFGRTQVERAARERGEQWRAEGVLCKLEGGWGAGSGSFVTEPPPKGILRTRELCSVTTPGWKIPGEVTCDRCVATIDLRLISLGDIRYVPTPSKLAIFHGFLTFWSNAPKIRSVGGGGGMCMLFEICEKKAVSEMYGLGGG